MSVSFKLGKTIRQPKLVSNALHNDNNARESVDDLDTVTHLEDKRISSTNKKNNVDKKKPLVIPMITQNRWVTNEHNTKDSLRNEAVAALIKESQADDSDSAPDQSAIASMLLNRVPEGFEPSEGSLNPSVRPEQASDADYDAVPIEAFGLAMMRGMGWEEGQPIGNTHKGVVSAKIPELRPKGLGLGADRSVAKQAAKPTATNASENKNGDELQLKIGSAVKIVSGPNRETYGKVQSFDEDNARVMVRLALGGNVVSVSQYGIKVVTNREYDRDSKCINKANYEKYKMKTERKRSPELVDLEDEPVKKRIKEEKREKKSSNKFWLRPDLRVRIIDKNIKRYYKEKVAIVDVAGRDYCNCRAGDGTLIEGVKQEQLETVIPRSLDTPVMVVAGPESGEVCRMVEKDKKKSRVTVQLLRSPQLVTISYDHVSEFVGDLSFYVD